METSFALIELYAGGLQGIFDYFVRDILIWIFLFAVVSVSIVFVKRNSFVTLAVFLAFSIIIGLVIWNARYLFGTKGQGGVGIAEGIAKKL